MTPDEQIAQLETKLNNFINEVQQHKHTGLDNKRIPLSETEYSKVATVGNPTGGINIDSEARAAINLLIDALQQLKLME